MELQRLKILVENELLDLVKAYSKDELAKADENSIRSAINQFLQRHGDELTVENIDFLTDYIWTLITKVNKKTNVNSKYNKSNCSDHLEEER